MSSININGPAYSSELKVGDAINYIDDKRLETINDLKEYIYSKVPGDKVVLKITRGKVNKEIEITLGKNS